MTVLRHGDRARAAHPAHPGHIVSTTDSGPVAHDRRLRP